MPLTILIAEDEDLIRNEVVRLTQTHFPEAHIVAVEDGDAALEAWEQYTPALAFLDIQMPGSTGLDVARALFAAEATTRVVFITAYNQHALAAFDTGAFDYLLKPLKEDRFAQTAARLRQQLAAPASPDPSHLQALLRQVADSLGKGARKEALKWISASTGQNIKIITLDEVMFFQSDNKYTRVVYTGGEALIRKPLRELIDELDGDVFKQVHRSHVVNMRAVVSIQRDGTGKGRVRFRQTPEEVDVSAAYMSIFKAL